jgi:phenylacetate-CoA ligase
VGFISLYSSNIYKKSPVLMQNVFVTIKGMTYRIVRRGRTFHQIERELLQNERLSTQDLRSLQFIKLKEIISHAYEYVPFYRKKFDSIGFRPKHLQTIGDLSILPILEKETLQQNYDEMISFNTKRRYLIKGSTSGTTGSSLSLYMDRKLIQSEHAFVWRQYRWAGCPQNGRIASFRGDMIVPLEQMRPPYWRYDLYSKELFFSSYLISEDTANVYLEHLEDFDPTLIYTYPSSIFSLAQYAKNMGVKYSFPSLRGIVTSSETLFEYQKSLIKEVFGVSIFDWYGSFERVIFVGTCEYGSYHIFPDYGFTEFIPLAETDGITYYELVGTGFINACMPLIRYRTGDIVTLDHGTCKCGRNFPLIGTILGRLDDLIVTPEGKVIGRLDHIFKNVKNIRLAQIIQEKINEIIIFIVPNAGYSIIDEKKILSNAIERIGGSINIKINLVSDIPRLPNGKFKGVISKVRPFRINETIDVGH